MNQQTIKQIEKRLKHITKLEEKLDSLILIRQVTIDKESIREITQKYNRFNLLYIRETGKEYVPIQ